MTTSKKSEWILFLFTRFASVAVAAIVLWCVAQTCAAQESVDNPTSKTEVSEEDSEATTQSVVPIKDEKTFVTGIYDLTQKADSISQYNDILDKCDQGLDHGVRKEYTAYLKQLKAWALNRRGEAYTEQAAELNAAGEAEQGAAKDAEALADFEAAIKEDPTRWKAIHNRGVNLALSGRYAESITDFTATIELKPNYTNAWYNRGEIYYELGKYPQAISDYSEAIRLEPEDHSFVISRGHAYFQQRKFRDALADYGKAVELAPESALAIANRADAYRSLAMWENAAKDYMAAVTLDPELGRAYQSAAWLMSTCPDSRFRNPALALKSARKAIELDGEEDYRYLDTLAAALANAGEYEQARDTLLKAIEIAPEVNLPALNQRLTLFKTGKPYRQQMRTASRETSESTSR